MDVLIDAPALRDYLGRGGPWAKESGQLVTKFRTRLGDFATTAWLANATSVTNQTIIEIEAGRLVPRDYLRAAIAFALGQDVETIWRPLTLERVREIGQVA